ncbi:capsule biosynthesis protein [Sphingomonas morindae]|uniref:Capsular biosynthesis protein n=1 Tax=Sphingomonas morindae TaxID=1541170 RepID=A0ABY4X671_9SPHN|nr:capsular biosynthesis protein [Sphingomonas morindae]USI72369.1 capsular biosynthesis protein [Sphingomonas morindae]
MKQRNRAPRAFLFLQGPHGSFFPKLGKAIEQAGCRVRRINLNGGDFATWPSGDNYRGTTSSWPGYIDRYLRRWGITDLVLFGDNRPPHLIAIEAAQRAGARVHVFEEGYVRPDWVTLERDGVNGRSSLPRSPEWYRAAAAKLPRPPVYPAIPSYRAARGWAAFFYYAEVVLQHWRFPFHGSHRSRNPVWEGIAYLRRFRQRIDRDALDREALSQLSGSPFFLLPLQLNSDYQIRVHSPFGSMITAFQMVLQSFVAHAPAECHLLVKEHPLESGLIEWRSIVADAAVAAGVADRVHFVQNADLLRLVQEARGVVTVNSTSGTLSLAAGIPTKVLGQAVYDIADITDQQPLDSFWRAPRGPDPATWDAFYRVLAHRCLIHGAFLSDIGIELLVAVATGRLLAEDEEDEIGVPASAQRGGR